MYTLQLRPGSLRRRIPAMVLHGACGCLFLSMSSCSFRYTLTIRGVILDAQTNEPIGNAAIGAKVIVDGQIVGQASAIDANGFPVAVPSDSNGAFALTVTESSRFARPDRIQLIIVRDGCEQRLMIETNEDTAEFVEGESSVSAVEITDPVVVPPCEESP